MASISKPNILQRPQRQNSIGLTPYDYEGVMSTLCAGCGHDSTTAAIIHALFDLAIPPHRIVKVSGIGCSSKTPTYFASSAHGINSIHGRMPSVATGASASNRDLHYIGISGDGDSLSIGLGQFVHAIRRNLNMIYILENNGVYGLTKGQFSASADTGSRLKKGEVNPYASIDPVLLALSLGAPYVARSFSGDKEELVPLIQQGIKHPGFAFIDVISPCVTFNDHEGSTKSYSYTRKAARALGSDEYDTSDAIAAHTFVQRSYERGEVVTGLLHHHEGSGDMHELAMTTSTPIVDIPYERLHPGAAGLDALQATMR